MDSKEIVRLQIFQQLEGYGIYFDKEAKRFVSEDVRRMQFQLAQHSNRGGLCHKDKVSNFFANPDEIDILQIDPYLVLVETEKHKRIWAYATSFWSIPVTHGYGRRIRFLVFDRQNEKLIGIVGLADPIIGLGTRDDFIGWDKEQKLKRLYNCMTAYILGAVPPYNLVLGSKLIALTLMFPEVRETFYQKYKNTVPLISGQKKKPHLIYVDTLGAFGKSAIYTKLQNWKFIGKTKGQSHIHITANGSWEIIRTLIPEEIFRSYKFGQGPNWKMRVLKAGLRELGFSEEMLSIGWQRGYYCCPLADNWKEFLLGETNKPIWKVYQNKELLCYWKERWVIPRIDSLNDKLKQKM